MKALRIAILPALSLLLCAPLSAAESKPAVPENPIESRMAQADTVRITWAVSSTSSTKSFSFYGEAGKSYKVDWGDEKTDTYTGKGPKVSIVCEHYYSKTGDYNVLLFGLTEK
ncbi:MAG: hypothetical protein NC048_04485 [Bacteroides sp.]|nr:hypothetical protein [Ruminococcus flavefaciens]MCM1554732.1 hypothetical protein [Bacteroides sp.]